MSLLPEDKHLNRQKLFVKRMRDARNGNECVKYPDAYLGKESMDYLHAEKPGMMTSSPLIRAKDLSHAQGCNIPDPPIAKNLLVCDCCLSMYAVPQKTPRRS